MGDVSGASVLWPRGDLARPTLGDALRQAGADVEEAVVYRTLPYPAGAARLRDLTADGALEAVVFASPSAVASALAGGVELSRLRCYSIGPATTDALQASGVAVAAQAESHDDDGLLAAIVKSETR
jgi:uroporphyrinogen-III synthase